MNLIVVTSQSRGRRQVLLTPSWFTRSQRISGHNITAHTHTRVPHNETSSAGNTWQHTLASTGKQVLRDPVCVLIEQNCVENVKCKHEVLKQGPTVRHTMVHPMIQLLQALPCWSHSASLWLDFLEIQTKWNLPNI